MADKARFGLLKGAMEAFEDDEIVALRGDGKLVRTKGSTTITMAGFENLDFSAQVYALRTIMEAQKDIIEHFLGEKQATLRNPANRIAVPVPGGMIVPPGAMGPQG